MFVLGFKGNIGVILGVYKNALHCPGEHTTKARDGLLLAYLHPPVLGAKWRVDKVAGGRGKYTDGAHYFDPDTCRMLPNLLGCGLAHLRRVRYGGADDLGPAQGWIFSYRNTFYVQKIQRT